MAVSARSITRRWVADHLPPRPARAHKGEFGRVLVVAGSIDYPGAALLTAIGAMRAGAGVVRVAAAESVVARLAGSVPEVTWMSLDEEAPGLIAPGGWRRVTAEVRDYDAAVIGPGLGRQPATQRRTRQLVGSIPIPTVVDADGLNALADAARWWQGLRSTLVLTPHPGEFARLTGGTAPDSDDDAARAEAASAAALRWSQVVVLKGANSVVAEPDGLLLRSDVVEPSLATAGSGDVLAGVIAALLAAGCRRFEAAACGVALHGAAGLLAAERIGRAGVMARDIAALVPVAIEQLRDDRPR
ncbi:MAG TPA: NAD(P)H-hydrate dehydratase [Candidatus Limnocylindrales bacterium]|nr:NAD(P)H-hydrate dehydratase [Candidatus Limnocylindrales bacterium]